MNDTPGGFARLRITPNGVLLPDYFNDGFCQMVGMNPSVIMQTYATDAMAAVHPDDREIIRRAASGIYESGEAQGIKYRLRRATGDYIPVVTFARLAQSESGERFLNVYFADATEQDKLETQRRELLDNLPCIAGLYEYRDGRVSIGHLNQRFAEIFGQETAKKEGASAFGNVHPDDQTQIRRGILEAMAAGSDYACDVRIRVINGSYQHFHLNSRILERGRGHWSIYVTLTPITDEALAIAEMLPVALQAVMATQTDYVYVKDRNLRFVCCSRAVARLVGLGNEAQLVGKTDHDVFDKELADQYVLDDRRVVEKGESVLNKLEIVPSSDGKTHYVNVSKYPLCDSRGGVVGLYGISRDVTQALETDTQLRLLTNSIPGGIATYELSPGQIRLTYFNDGFCRLFGLTREACEKDVERDSLKNVNPKDVPALKAQIDALLSDNIPVDCIYRAHTHEGDDKWINIKAVISDRHGDKVTVNAVLFDVTEQQNAMERVRISEEANRLAISHSGCIICRYTVADRTATVPPEIAKAYAIPEQVFDVPYGPVRDGLIAPESVSAYVGFYEDILRGTAGGSVVYRERFHEGWTWREAHFSTIFSDDGKPVSAVISFFDVSDRMEKEAAYKKWQQSMQERDPQSYTLFRCNISKNTPFDTQEGALLNVDYRGGTTTFDERTLEYARQWVYEKDRAAYVAFVKSDALLAGYYRGKHTGAIEYRENLPKGGLRWLRLNVDLVEYPNSSDVEAYLMYENIDQSKRAELLTIERAETDPLTGVLNRSTFAAQIEQKIAELSPGKQHALLMLDVDGFKQVNDVFGHGAGDQVLIDMAVALRSVLRRDDLLGRLGGDEFVVFLNDIPSDAVAAQKAKEILALTRKSLSPDVSISGSIGIAMCPRQGTDFETLYKKADDALYHVKGSGKDSYAFHRDGMEGEREEEEPAAPHVSSAPKRKQKRRMLIVENDRLVCARYRDLFADDFLVECARDGATALIRLRHYGSAISVVLLSLSIPDTDGFLVLEAMQKGAQTQYVPVIAISEDPSREKGLKAIRAGATDYVTKPVDEGLLRIRVQSAVSKAENERLRVQNSFLSLQGDEVKRYKTVLERSGTVVVEYDWLKGTFKYDPAMSRHFAGAYDTRSFWHILLSDMVADTRTVRNMQALVHALAEDRDRGEGSLTVLLKTPGKVMKPFTMTVYKIANEYGLTEKMLITLKRREAD